MIRVRVPGTSANLGPGFDCLGLALGVYGDFTFEEREQGLVFENIAPEYRTRDNLAVRAYMRTLRELGIAERGLYLSISSDIPVSSGLGSSASLLVAGAVAANALHGSMLGEQAILNIVTELEGHPDNVAPALLGGLTASMMTEQGVISMRSPLSRSLKVCALIPDFPLSTSKARAALPRELPYGDAVYNISRVSVLLRALELGDEAAIRLAMQDRLHQPYRAKLIDEYERVRELAFRCGALGFCISGAGPTLLAFYKDERFVQCVQGEVQDFRNTWRVLPLAIDTAGARVMEVNG